ncbi:MAG: asparaginase, partial [Candidatus Dormibacteria bacterium]
MQFGQAGAPADSSSAAMPDPGRPRSGERRDRDEGAPAVLARIFRGAVEEGVIRGHIAVVDGDGQMVSWAGNPRAMTTLRSSFKPFQASSFVESGTADLLGLGEASVAIAGASHHGEPAHLEVVRAILEAAHLPESALRCGVHLPSDPLAASQLLARGEPPTALHNNCSGKHAAMVAVCAHRGWPLESYLDRHHPLQEEIAARLGRSAGLDPTTIPYGTDGCGLPTFGLAVEDFARALSHAASTDPAFRRCLAAMANHPFLVAGTGAFDTVLMESEG